MVVSSIKSDLDTSDVCEYFFVVDRNQPVKFCKQFEKMSTKRLKTAKAAAARRKTVSKLDLTKLLAQREEVEDLVVVVATSRRGLEIFCDYFQI